MRWLRLISIISIFASRAQAADFLIGFDPYADPSVTVHLECRVGGAEYTLAGSGPGNAPVKIYWPLNVGETLECRAWATDPAKVSIRSGPIKFIYSGSAPSNLCVVPAPSSIRKVSVNGTRIDRPTYDISVWKTTTTMKEIGRVIIGASCGSELIRKTTVEYYSVRTNEMSVCTLQ